MIGSIPRRIRRMVDQRGEARFALGIDQSPTDRPPNDQSPTGHAPRAHLEWRGRSVPVEIVNRSSSGAMALCAEIPHIGEAVALQLPEQAPAAGVVRWVRDGRIGIYFAAAVE